MLGLSNFAKRPHYRAYLVLLLAAILALSYLDRVAIGLVLPYIKRALALSDTELGVLTGIAFSLFYSTVGIPIGRWADRGDRVKIIALTTALWGVMVMLVGAARSFETLLIVRIGVAVGEAGCLPAAYSLIGDYFAREERPRAIANYLLGAMFSGTLGYLAAGWLSYRYGWRIMFVCIGIPSVVVAPLAWWALSEPRRTRRHPGDLSTSSGEPPSTMQVILTLWGTKTFRYLLAAICVNAFFGHGLAVWQPSFFARSYGMTTEQLGLYFAVVYGVAGVIGTYSGGYLASRYAPRNERLQLRSLAPLNVGFGLLSSFIYLSKTPLVGMAFLGLAVIGGTLENGPVLATAQAVIPEKMRAVSVSIIYLFANLVGAGLGPLAVGALSDLLRPYAGDESLRYALLAMCPGYLWAGWLLWQAARTVVADVGETGGSAMNSSDVRRAQA